jgi:hypothetical protein
MLARSVYQKSPLTWEIARQSLIPTFLTPYFYISQKIFDIG